MKNYLLLFGFLLSFVTILFSQNKMCGSDFILQKNLQENPEKIIVRNQLESFTKEFITTFGNTKKMGQEQDRMSLKYL